MKIGYYCLSLKKYRKIRYLITKKESFDPNNINIKEVEGVDGSKFNTARDIAKKFDITLDEKIKKSSPILIAIAQSHRNIWKIILESDYDYGIIFEDDIVIKNNNFDQIIKDKINLLKLKSNIFILSIGYLSVSKHLTKIDSDISKIGNFSGFQSYLISKKTAEYLYQQTFYLNDQIDTIVSNYLNIDKYCFNKRLVYQKSIESIAHNQRIIFLEYNNFKFFAKRIGINFKINISTGYHINLTLYSIINFMIACIFKYFELSSIICFYYFIILLFETFIYGGINFTEYTIFSGLNKYSKYDDDEVVNKLIDYLLFCSVYIIW